MPLVTMTATFTVHLTGRTRDDLMAQWGQILDHLYAFDRTVSSVSQPIKRGCLPGLRDRPRHAR